MDTVRQRKIFAKRLIPLATSFYEASTLSCKTVAATVRAIVAASTAPTIAATAHQHRQTICRVVALCAMATKPLVAKGNQMVLVSSIPMTGAMNRG